MKIGNFCFDYKYDLYEKYGAYLFKTAKFKNQFPTSASIGFLPLPIAFCLIHVVHL